MQSREAETEHVCHRLVNGGVRAQDDMTLPELYPTNIDCSFFSLRALHVSISVAYLQRHCSVKLSSAAPGDS